jgi:AcrR family transcriptional regulator
MKNEGDRSRKQRRAARPGHQPPKRGKQSRTQVREAILDAARRLLRTQGLASTRDLARAAGVADGALYNHFHDRVDVYVALLEESLPTLRAALASLPLKVGEHSVAQNLEWVGEQLLLFHYRVVPLFAVLLAEQPVLKRFQARLVAEERGSQRSREPIAAYLRAEQRLGRISAKVDVELATELLIGASFQRAFRAHFEQAALTSGGGFVAGIVRTLLAGLSPR